MDDLYFDNLSSSEAGQILESATESQNSTFQMSKRDQPDDEFMEAYQQKIVVEPTQDVAKKSQRVTSPYKTLQTEPQAFLNIPIIPRGHIKKHTSGKIPFEKLDPL